MAQVTVFLELWLIATMICSSEALREVLGALAQRHLHRLTLTARV